MTVTKPCVDERTQNYYNKIYGIEKINKNNEIRVMTSSLVGKEEKTMVDIRRYSLYGNNYDNQKRYTKKGIKFKIDNIPTIVYSLVSILHEQNKISDAELDEIRCILNVNR